MDLVHLADRRYLLFRPPGPAADPPPVVVLLHGTGGTAAWADDETGLSAVAARERFVLAIPDALPPDPAGPPKFFSNPQRWNDGSEPVSSTDDVEFLTAVVTDAVARGPADPRRVFVTGFSNGAGMTFRFAAERADLVAAIAPVAGYCPSLETAPVVPVPTLFVIGAADPLVPPAGGVVRSPWGGKRTRPPIAESLATWAAAIGCTPAPTTVRESADIREDVYPGGVEFRAVVVAGLGHHWPGGKGRFDPRFAGPPSDRVSGNDLVWEFFRRHRRA